MVKIGSNGQLGPRMISFDVSSKKKKSYSEWNSCCGRKWHTGIIKKICYLERFVSILGLVRDVCF